jgi:O-antigen biosynthesis protein
MSEPLVSIVVRVSDADAFRARLAALESSIDAARAPYEIVVLVQSADARAADALFGTGYVVGVRTRMNVGTAPGYNLAARRARGEYLAFVHEESNPGHGWLERLLETMAANPDAGIVGSRIVDAYGAIVETGMLHADGSARAAEDAFERTSEVDALPADGLLIRTRSFHALGGFDAQYGQGFDDYDLCFSVRHVLNQRVLRDGRSTIVRTVLPVASFDAGFTRFLHEKHRAAFREKWSAVLAAYPERSVPEPSAAEPPIAPSPQPAPEPAPIVVESRAEPSPEERAQYESDVVHDLREELGRVNWRAEAASAMLRATDRHASALERRTIELEGMVLTLQSHVDALNAQLAARTAT